MYSDDFAVEQSIINKRAYGLSLHRNIYFLMALTLALALVFATFALQYPSLADFLRKYWIVAAVAFVIALLLLIFSYFINSFRREPLNMIIYVLFTLCFIWFVAWAVVRDPTFLLYFVLWIVLLALLGYLLYSFSTTGSVSALASLVIVVTAAVAVLLVFLIFTNVSFLWLLFAALGAMVFSYYLNYDVRKAARGTLMDPTTEDAWTGAVRGWAEGHLVLCHFLEMIGYGCCKRKIGG